MSQCDYCGTHHPEGPGILIVQNAEGGEAFKGCIACLLNACKMFVDDHNRCHCPLGRGCTCGAFKREMAAKVARGR